MRCIFSDFIILFLYFLKYYIYIINIPTVSGHCPPRKPRKGDLIHSYKMAGGANHTYWA